MKLNGPHNKVSVQVYVADYNCGLPQNWRQFSGEFKSDRESRKLTLKNSVSRKTHQRVTTRGTFNSDENVKWAFSSKNINCFGIQDVVNESRIIAIDGKVKSILQSKRDAKYWFWEGDTTHSKENPMFVLTVQNTGNNRWALAADKFQDSPPTQKVQAFTYFENFIIVQIE